MRWVAGCRAKTPDAVAFTLLAYDAGAQWVLPFLTRFPQVFTNTIAVGEPQFSIAEKKDGGLGCFSRLAAVLGENGLLWMYSTGFSCHTSYVSKNWLRKAASKMTGWGETYEEL